MLPEPRPELASLPTVPHGGVTAAELADHSLSMEEVLDFSVSTNPFGPPPGVAEVLASVCVSHYPDPQAARLQSALAQANGLASDQVIVTNGSVELIWLACQAYLRPADTALVVGPTFGEYARAAAIAGARLICWDARPDEEFHVDAADLEDHILANQPRLVFICNPNNPTGVLLAESAIELLIRATQAAKGLVVLDEAYIGLVAEENGRAHLGPSLATRTVGRSSALLVARSLTKDYALAGLRLGYGLAQAEIVAQLRKVQPPWSVNAPAQAAGLFALSDHTYLERSRLALSEVKQELVTDLQSLGFRPLPSAANFFLLEVGDGAAFRRALLDKRCVVRDCASFGLPRHVRIGVRGRSACRHLVEAIQELLRERRLELPHRLLTLQPRVASAEFAVSRGGPVQGRG